MVIAYFVEDIIPDMIIPLFCWSNNSSKFLGESNKISRINKEEKDFKSLGLHMTEFNC